MNVFLHVNYFFLERQLGVAALPRDNIYLSCFDDARVRTPKHRMTFLWSQIQFILFYTFVYLISEKQLQERGSGMWHVWVSNITEEFSSTAVIRSNLASRRLKVFFHSIDRL
jgi:hypothetical protein